MSSRDDFRTAVLLRDRGLCVVCGEPATDVHHLLNRNLWGESGGYDPDNGVSLCEKHHVLAEQSFLSVEALRDLAGISHVVLPPDFDPQHEYDCWGNIALTNGHSIKGPLFNTEGCQKALSYKLGSFLPFLKFPKIFHVPWSPGLQNDDRKHPDMDCFGGLEIVATIKMDGENTSMYPPSGGQPGGYIHARSVDSKHHESRAWVKGLHAQIAGDIPPGWHLSGENLFAKHSIHYHNLKSYFNLFSVWDDQNRCLSWDETVEYAALLGLTMVPVFYRGIWDASSVTSAFEAYQRDSKDPVEGYVIRVVGSIPYAKFQRSYAKWVRAGHVQTSEFWMTQPVVPNELGSDT